MSSLTRLRRKLGRKLNPYLAESYSHEGEDLILKKLFSEPGYYIDVGANHPLRYSNSYLFYLRGWKGLAIEPNPLLSSLWEKYRPKDIFVNCGVAKFHSVATYYEFNEDALNTFSLPVAKERDKLSQYFRTNDIEITCFPLSDILDKYLRNNQEITFISIDVEGMEEEVLFSLDLNKYQPKCLVIELLKADKNKIEDYLEQFNYTVFAKLYSSVFFLKT